MQITLLSFIESFFSPEELVKIRKYCGNSNLTGRMGVSEAIHIVMSCPNDYFRKDFPYMPECVREKTFGSDHDHGAWTERFVFKHGEKYLALEIEFWGQGDYDDKDILMYEVKPREVTTIVYDRA